MTRYVYIVDTSIVNGGDDVGQNTYDLLIDERLNHGVIPVEENQVGGGSTWVYTPIGGGTQIGIHTTKNVGIGGTALEDFQLKIHGSLDTNIAGVGVATIGIVTFGGTYETVRPNDKILSPTNNSVALTEIGGNNIIAIDVAQETVAIGTIGRAPQYNFSNVSLENKRMSTVSVIGLGSGPGNVSAGNDYTINGGSVKQLTWATASTPNFDSSHYNIITFRILQDSVVLTSVFAVKE
jgi:hypothetical protein